MALPYLKYVGGKTKLIPELVARMPRTFGRYFEPFCGSAALCLHLAEDPTWCDEHRPTISDLNGHLIHTHRVLATALDRVVDQLRHCATQHDEQFYRARRASFNAGSLADVDRAACFIYLNKAGYNGMYRVNKRGEFNVPVGRTADGSPPLICDESTLRAAATVLFRCEIWPNDYADALSDVDVGDFIYFDPPYVPLNPTSNFTSYTSGGFGEREQRDLASSAAALVVRGAKVMLSNSDTPLVHELYQAPTWAIERVSRSGSFSSKGEARGKVGEVIITGGYDEAEKNRSRM